MSAAPVGVVNSPAPAWAGLSAATGAPEAAMSSSVAGAGLEYPAWSSRRRRLAQHQWRSVHFIHAQLPQSYTEPDNVNQRVHAAQLFQLQRLFRLAVYSGFGFPQSSQDFAGLLLHRRVEGAGLDCAEQHGGRVASAVRPDGP